MSWTVIESKSGVYDFEIGISTTKSEVPDLLDFKSSNHHTHLTISHPNINDGSVFYFIIKTVSRSGVENIQVTYSRTSMGRTSLEPRKYRVLRKFIDII